MIVAAPMLARTMALALVARSSPIAMRAPAVGDIRREWVRENSVTRGRDRKPSTREGGGGARRGRRRETTSARRARGGEGGAGGGEGGGVHGGADRGARIARRRRRWNAPFEASRRRRRRTTARAPRRSRTRASRGFRGGGERRRKIRELEARAERLEEAEAEVARLQRIIEGEEHRRQGTPRQGTRRGETRRPGRGKRRAARVFAPPRIKLERVRASSPYDVERAGTSRETAQPSRRTPRRRTRRRRNRGGHLRGWRGAPSRGSRRAGGDQGCAQLRRGEGRRANSRLEDSSRAPWRSSPRLIVGGWRPPPARRLLEETKAAAADAAEKGGAKIRALEENLARAEKRLSEMSEDASEVKALEVAKSSLESELLLASRRRRYSSSAFHSETGGRDRTPSPRG